MAAFLIGLFILIGFIIPGMILNGLAFQAGDYRYQLDSAFVGISGILLTYDFIDGGVKNFIKTPIAEKHYKELFMYKFMNNLQDKYDFITPKNLYIFFGIMIAVLLFLGILSEYTFFLDKYRIVTTIIYPIIVLPTLFFHITYPMLYVALCEWYDEYYNHKDIGYFDMFKPSIFHTPGGDIMIVAYIILAFFIYLVIAHIYDGYVSIGMRISHNNKEDNVKRWMQYGRRTKADAKKDILLARRKNQFQHWRNKI